MGIFKQKTKLAVLVLLGTLGLLSASGASANFFSYAVGNSTGESNAHYEAEQKAQEQKQKAMAEGRISCVPQQSSDNLWKCEDAYGNQFNNLIIVKQEEFNRVKNGRNIKRAGN
jgi:hypothetical protein